MPCKHTEPWYIKILLPVFLLAVGWSVLFIAEHREEARRAYLTEQRELYSSHRALNPDCDYLGIPQFLDENMVSAFAVITGFSQVISYSWPKERIGRFFNVLGLMCLVFFRRLICNFFASAFCREFFSKQISLRAGPGSGATC